jgi:hypothetical protein
MHSFLPFSRGLLYKDIYCFSKFSKFSKKHHFWNSPIPIDSFFYRSKPQTTITTRNFNYQYIGFSIGFLISQSKVKPKIENRPRFSYWVAEIACFAFLLFWYVSPAVNCQPSFCWGDSFACPLTTCLHLLHSICTPSRFAFHLSVHLLHTICTPSGVCFLLCVLLKNIYFSEM